MELIIKKIIKYLFIPFGILYTFLKNEKNEIIILMYHRVNNRITKELSVTNKNFRWQMNYLKRRNYRVISMDEAYEKIETKNINGKYIVLTFDDGYEDFYHNAYPVLEKYNFPSIIYLVPGFIDTNKVFWWDKDLDESRLMSWSQINELAMSKSVDIGSHTLNHYDMNKLSGQELRYELEMSKKILEDKTNTRINHFSYPRGIFSEVGEEIVKELYSTGVLIFNGRKIIDGFNSNYLTKLKRIPVQHSDGKYLFIARINGWLVLEEVIRKWISK